MHEAGYKVIGIGEWDGGLYNTNGIDIATLLGVPPEGRHNPRLQGRRESRCRRNCSSPNARSWCRPQPKTSSPRSMPSKVKAKILVEGANGPTTAAADDILADKGVFVIPDILANAGGVTASYFEWVQDRQGYFWKESVVNEQLEHIMVSSFEDVVRYAETHHVNNRIAAYMLAIDRVAYTIRQRGIYA